MNRDRGQFTGLTAIKREPWVVKGTCCLLLGLATLVLELWLLIRVSGKHCMTVW